MVEGRPAVALTIGVFDGVHRGHQSLILQMVEHAKADHLVIVCITFDPDPAVVIDPGRPQPALSTIEDRRERLSRLGVTHVDVVTFTREVSLQSPEQFIEGLRQRYNLRALWVGGDFAFGRDRAGTVRTLQRIGREQGFDVFALHLLRHENRPISSTWIRELLAEGNVTLTRELLGRPYCIEGAVVAGARRGRQIGFPTANVVPPANRALPADGVYFVRATVSAAGSAGVGVGEHAPAPGPQPPTPSWWYGVVNLGARPTFDEAGRLVETHLLDFDGDVYGADISVCFLRQLRGIRRFSGPQELRAQIERDVAAARELIQLERSDL